MNLVKNHFSVVCIALLLSAAAFAQEFQGQAYYFSKTSVDMDSWGGRKMSEDQKKQIANRMRSMFEKTYILTFDREASNYKEEEVLEAPGAQGGFGKWRGAGLVTICL